MSMLPPESVRRLGEGTVSVDRAASCGYNRGVGSIPGLDERTRRLLSAARVGRLATVRPDGTPHLVPLTFALAGDTLVSAIDAKPKRTRDLQRLRNLRSNPAATVLVDEYAEDWSLLWWVRVDGRAEVVTDEPRRSELLAPLVAKYAQYADRPPEGPAVLLHVERVTSWSARPG
jgi:PPOX class probable F420-dependent enzyme